MKKPRRKKKTKGNRGSKRCHGGAKLGFYLFSRHTAPIWDCVSHQKLVQHATMWSAAYDGQEGRG